MVIKPEHTALYKQVYEYMLTRIKTGEWEKGKKLPSVRSLAELLGVHRLTILKAYQLLKEEGYVYAKDKTGYYCKTVFTKVKQEKFLLSIPTYKTAIYQKFIVNQPFINFLQLL